jgi:anthranilate phosphoribosyltransferase
LKFTHNERVKSHEYSTSFKPYYKKIHLTQPQMEDVMRAIMSGEATDAQIGALMMGFA